jgi:NAD(P)H-hydrate epimerase
MRAAEETAFKAGAQVEALMDKAGAGVARAVQQFFPRPGMCSVYAGKGHNGGDALVAAEQLRRAGWSIDLHLAFPDSVCSELTRKKLSALRQGQGDVAQATRLRSTENASGTLAPPSIILDGLLGLGAKSLLREPVRAAAREINKRRRDENAFVFAVDLPTGLDGDTGETDPEDCVTADFTITIGYAKHGLIVDSALDFVGRLEVVPLAELVLAETKINEVLATAHSLNAVLPRREFSAYKNQFGRIGVVAGSEGFIGAGLMTTEGALRAGAGLVELFVPKEIYPTVAAAAPAEAMVKPIRSYRDLLEETVDIWAVGPGLGTARDRELLPFIELAEQPMVLDADALNILSQKIEILSRCRGPRLLTPHPGEMKRLFEHGKMSRAGTARHFCDQFSITLLLKGSRTIVCERERPLSYNSTGNPGMATGGMGDVLTGVCAGLAGRKLTFYDAARIGAWACGRAAEISIFNAKTSEESLLAREILAHLGEAFNDLRNPTV